MVEKARPPATDCATTEVVRQTLLRWRMRMAPAQRISHRSWQQLTPSWPGRANHLVARWGKQVAFLSAIPGARNGCRDRRPYGEITRYLHKPMMKQRNLSDSIGTPAGASSTRRQNWQKSTCQSKHKAEKTRLVPCRPRKGGHGVFEIGLVHGLLSNHQSR